MKKLTVKLCHNELSSLDKWLEVSIEEQMKEEVTGYTEACATALIAEWRIKKVHPHTHFFTTSKTTLKLDAALAFALMHYIANYPIPVTSQLGNRLLMVSREIDQHFD